MIQPETVQSGEYLKNIQCSEAGVWHSNVPLCTESLLLSRSPHTACQEPALLPLGRAMVQDPPGVPRTLLASRFSTVCVCTTLCNVIRPINNITGRPNTHEVIDSNLSLKILQVLRPFCLPAPLSLSMYFSVSLFLSVYPPPTPPLTERQQLWFESTGHYKAR